MKLQEAPAASDPPEKVIVRGAVVVSEPPLQVAVGPEVVTVKPAGKVSVKANPVKDWLPAAALLIVNVSTDVPLSAIGLVPNDLVMAGSGGGFLQPVKVTLSTYPSAPGFVFPEL